jgi:ankyrin repeat protein
LAFSPFLPRLVYQLDHIAMARAFDLGSLPPELIYDIVEHLDQSSLSSLARSSIFLHALTSDLLYTRDAARYKSTGLVRCIRSGATKSVSKFIAAGVDVNATINIYPDMEDFAGDTTLLAIAVARNQIDVVRLLLSHGADVCARIDAVLCYSVLAHPWADANPVTPLSLAITHRQADVATELVNHMLHPDAVVSTIRGIEYTALEQAALCLCPSIVHRLLERGADPDQRSRTGATILYKVMANYDVHRWADGLPDGGQLIGMTVVALLMYGANPALRPYPPVLPDTATSEQSKIGASLFLLGIDSPYPQIRQHFAELLHRRVCERSVCRERMYDYGVPGADIPGHCAISRSQLTPEELRFAETVE